MKKNGKKMGILTLFVLFISTSFTNSSTTGSVIWGMSSKYGPYIDLEKVFVVEEVVDEMEDFLNAIGHKESRNQYDIVNKYGYMGRYQFGKRTLKGLGYDVSKQEFLSNPEIQEMAMQDLLKHNKEKLQKYIDLYEGDTLHGIFITESGVLAAAHLAGCGNVKKFFTKGYDFKDGFGTRLTSYMEKFSGYNLILE
jgi:hypothetical protein